MSSTTDRCELHLILWGESGSGFHLMQDRRIVGLVFWSPPLTPEEAEPHSAAGQPVSAAWWWVDGRSPDIHDCLRESNLTEASAPVDRVVEYFEVVQNVKRLAPEWLRRPPPERE